MDGNNGRFGSGGGKGGAGIDFHQCAGFADAVLWKNGYRFSGVEQSNHFVDCHGAAGIDGQMLNIAEEKLEKAMLSDLRIDDEYGFVG